MGCNSTLTDAQLKSMFVMTDEEMRQVEQPMECLIDRTQHKCKRHTRFFSKETAINNTTVNLPLKRINAPTLVKPSIPGWTHFIEEWTLNT